MSDIRIRLGLQADLPVVRDLYRRASLSNSGDREALLAHPEVLVLTDEGITEGRMRVATSTHGQIVGFATTLQVGSALELEDLFVDPDWMRRGVARRLVLDVVALARREAAQRIEVTANPHAMTFYGAVGFVSDGAADTQFGPGVRMHLDVAAEPVEDI